MSHWFHLPKLRNTVRSESLNFVVVVGGKCNFLANFIRHHKRRMRDAVLLMSNKWKWTSGLLMTIGALSGLIISSKCGFCQGVQVFCSSGCPAGISIPDAGCSSNDTATSTILVSGVGTIDNTYGLEKVCVYIPHTWRSDLDIYLQAPDGTQVELSTDNGGSGDNFGAGCNSIDMLCFSAGAATSITAWSSTDPATGTYKPEGCLGVVNNGQNADGVWTLQVCDDVGADVGSIQGWCLVFSGNPAPYSPVAPDFSFTAPFTHTSTTCGAGNDVPSTCDPDYGGGEDVVYRVTFSSAGDYKIVVTNNSGTGYTGWFLTGSQPTTCGMGGCVAQMVSASGNTATACVNIPAAGDYYIVVDHDASIGPSCANYTLEVLLPLNVYFSSPAFIVVQGVQDTFYVNAATDCGAAIVNWCQWDFGDGTPIITSTDNDTFHTYSTAGTYTLRVTCASGPIVDRDSAIVTVVASCPAPTCTGFISLAGADDPGIYSVSLKSYVNNSSGASEGNIDLSCSAGPYVMRGDRDTLIVRMGPASSGRVLWYVKAWADWNNNGILELGEILGESISSSNTSTIVFDVPLSATVGSAVRLRVLGMAYDGFPHGPCDTILFGQYEDYGLVIMDYTQPPVALFRTNSDTVCDSTVIFENQSFGVVTSWTWDFGDGNTTTSVWSPAHAYASPGVYNVKLKVCNSFGCDSLVRQVVVRSDIGAPKPPSCVPHRLLSDPLSFGIFKVRVGDMTRVSGQSPDGYSDFTCPDTAHIMEGVLSTVLLVGSPTAAQDWRIWLDLNNDGVLQHPSELLLSVDNTTDSTFVIKVPWGAAPKGVPLRMRVLTEAGGTLTPATDPCYSPALGEVEDYSVFIDENTLPPIAQFETQPPSPEGGCGYLSVRFVDRSLNAVNRWVWYFGDGDTSNEQNPVHLYDMSGFYSAFLVACGPYGCDTSDTVLISVYSDCIYYMPPASWDSVMACSGILYDNGGRDGNYADVAASYFKIHMPDAIAIELTFDSFYYAPSDALNIYCSSSPSGAPDYSFTQASPPQLGSPYICSNTDYVVVKHSPVNDGVAGRGFRLRWSAVSNSPPLVDFVVDYDGSDFCNMEYTFINRSTCVDSWYWITEDGAVVGTYHLHYRFFAGGPGSASNLGITQPYISAQELNDDFLTVVLVGKRRTPQGELRNWKKLSLPIMGVKADFTVVPSPVVELSYGGRVYFRDKSLTYRNLIYNKWLFGTGDSAENFDNVMHVYTDTGTYIVTYIACNDVCCDTAAKVVRVVGVRTEPVITDIGDVGTQDDELLVFPNPFREGVVLLLREDNLEGDACIFVRNMVGRVVASRCISSEAFQMPYFMDLSFLPQSVYIIEVSYTKLGDVHTERTVVVKSE